MTKSFQIKICHSISEIDESAWDLLDHHSPFTSFHFLSALEKSGSTSLERGWQPLIITVMDQDQTLVSALIGHLKAHSYGEYIFDWNIAQAYEQAGHQYYPKFCSSIPFTPVNTQKILTQKNKPSSLAISEIIEHLETNSKLSSYHHLFIPQETARELENQGYIPRLSLQYHWQNQNYSSFNDFLNDCTSSKRKMIKKEREKINRSGLNVLRIEPEQLKHYVKQVYSLYLETIQKKAAIAYLNQSFFELIFQTLKKDILLDLAFEENELIAFSLFFQSSNTLYGRYWGVKSEKEMDYPFLHFEMCYYRGIEYCIKQQFNQFEAGAQGTHKISRGFRPLLIYSAHKFSDVKWHRLIEDYMKKEAHEIQQIVSEQSQLLPFRLSR